jgi:hypothetical protein
VLSALREVLRDPLCRWEARRYWTARRYVWTAMALVGFGLLGTGCLFGYLWWLEMLQARLAGAGGGAGTRISVDALDLWGKAILAGFYTVGAARLPLSVAAGLAGALALAPERFSGQLEQFVLTPVDPARFALARAVGRLKGILVFWLALGAFLAVLLVAVLFRGMPDPTARPESGAADVLALLQGGLGQVDLGLMLMLDVAVGMYFSARSRSVAWAVAMALLVSLVVMPVILYLPAFIISLLLIVFNIIAGGGTVADPSQSVFALLGLLGAVLHLGLGILALRLWMKWVRRAVRQVFLSPEAP